MLALKLLVYGDEGKMETGNYCNLKRGSGQIHSKTAAQGAMVVVR